MQDIEMRAIQSLMVDLQTKIWERRVMIEEVYRGKAQEEERRRIGGGEEEETDV
jgi:hypothetical protein